MRGKIWRIGDGLGREEGEGRKFGTSGSIVFDGCFSGVMVRENLTRGGPAH